MKEISRKVIFVKRNHVRCTNKLYMKFTIYLQTTVHLQYATYFSVT